MLETCSVYDNKIVNALPYNIKSLKDIKANYIPGYENTTMFCCRAGAFYTKILNKAASYAMDTPQNRGRLHMQEKYPCIKGKKMKLFVFRKNRVFIRKVCLPNEKAGKNWCLQCLAIKKNKLIRLLMN